MRNYIGKIDGFHIIEDDSLVLKNYEPVVNIPLLRKILKKEVYEPDKRIFMDKENYILTGHPDTIRAMLKSI